MAFVPLRLSLEGALTGKCSQDIFPRIMELEDERLRFSSHIPQLQILPSKHRAAPSHGFLVNTPDLTILMPCSPYGHRPFGGLNEGEDP
jgi:hypothetical protein